MSTQDNPTPSGDGDTGSGFLVGVDPAQPRQATDWQSQNAAQSVTQPVQVTPGTIQPTGRTFSEDDIERARQQEKDKLYPRLQTMEEELKALRKERETEAQEKQRLADEAAAAQRAKEEGEMEVRSLLERKEQEWDTRFRTLEQQREADQAVFEQERRFTQLQDYRRDRITQEQEFIMPELRDLISGSSETEIDNSIESMKLRTEQILGNITAATQHVPRGAAPTAPPVGPMEQQPNYEQLSPDDIRNMDPETYKRYRPALLEAASRQFKGNR